jgi:hypothetical protein
MRAVAESLASNQVSLQAQRVDREKSVMNSAIKIIKRDKPVKPNNLSADNTEKGRERDTASTVQGWVAEWAERKRSLQYRRFHW